MLALPAGTTAADDKETKERAKIYFDIIAVRAGRREDVTKDI